MSALKQGLLELGLEDLIPLWEIPGHPEVKREPGVSPSIEEISTALIDLLESGQIVVLAGQWTEAPELVEGDEAVSLLQDPRGYSSAEENRHGLDRVYFVNRDNWRPSD